MNYLLWYQNKYLTSPDGFIIDGIQQDVVNNKEQESFFSLLRKAEKWREALTLPIFKQRFPDSSKQLQVRFGEDNSVLVQSHFITRDEQGRLIPYEFYTNDSSCLIEQLKSATKESGYEINSADIQLINKVLGLRRNKKTFLIGGIVLIALITILTWN